MATLTGQEIWDALSKEPAFKQQTPECVRSILRKFIDPLPGLLAEQLDAPVTILSMTEAKLIFMKHCLQNGFMNEMSAAQYPNGVDGVSLEEIVAMGNDALGALLESSDELASSIAEQIANSGVREAQLIAKQLNPAARKEFRSGKLTIGKLLTVQPSLIVLEQEKK